MKAEGGREEKASKVNCVGREKSYKASASLSPACNMSVAVSLQSIIYVLN